MMVMCVVIGLGFGMLGWVSDLGVGDVFVWLNVVEVCEMLIFGVCLGY